MSVGIGGKYIYVAVFTANMLGFLCGAAMSWSSPMLAKLTDGDIDGTTPFNRPITSEEQSWISSLTTLGAVLGPLLFTVLIDKIGRKLTAIIIGLPFLVSYLTLSFAKTVTLYYIARFIMGLGNGGVFSVIPIYLVEISKNSIRGKVAASITMFIIAGICFSYCLGPYVTIMVFNLVLTGIAVAFFPLFYFLAPETPYYHVTNNKDHHAKKSLHILRRKSSNTLGLELKEIKEYTESIEKGGVLDIFKTKGARKALMITVVLTSLQQFSGINVILAFTQQIFDAAGSNVPSEIASIIVGCVQLLTSFISPLLSDKAGRKVLLIISITGGLISEIVLGIYFFLKAQHTDVSGISWLPVTCLVLFIIFYNFGFGSLPWAIMGEILPINVISVGSAIASSIYWMFGFLLTRFFDPLTNAIGMGPTFWLFAGFCVLCDLFVIFILFETKGKSLQKIQEILNA